MKRFKSLALLLLTLISTISIASVSHAITIDEFEDGADVSNWAISTAQNVEATKLITSAKAVGGNRALRIVKTSSASGAAILYTDSKLSHSQGDSVRALATVTWDGDTNPTNRSTSNLGVINLSQDGADKVLLSLTFDYANGQPAEFSIKFFNSPLIGLDVFSSVTVQLNQALNSPFLIEIPFSYFDNVGTSSIPAPSGTFTTNTSFGSGGKADLTKVKAIQFEINGQNGDSDLGVYFIKTNGICDESIPDTDGNIVDDCGICNGDPLYKLPKDDCGYCPNDKPNYKNYSQTKDSCLNCKNLPTYIAPDLCNRCPVVNPNYGAAKDPCGVCDGDGSSCNDCSLRPQNIDRCGVCDGDGTTCLDCAGVPFGGKTIDKCGDCGGTITDPALCDVDIQCTTVEATGEILTFEKRLVEQATTIKKKFDGEKSRNKRNKCGINVKPSEQKVKKAYETIKNVGNDIFTKGVEICGEGCVTVSYADQVKALMPTLKVIEKQTKSLANKVKKCYQKKKIKTTNSVAGVVTTINDVQSELNQLIQDCKDKQVCK